MNQVILIKYGELTTKKGNRKLFINTLYRNVLKKLNDYPVKITSDISRMYIEFPLHLKKDILKKLKEIFGIHVFFIAYQVNSDLKSIETNVTNILKEKINSHENYTFKVETKRSDKQFPMDSIKMSKYLGGIILKTFENLQVDVHNPDILVGVEIRKENTYIYFKEEKGLGGYPVGALGHGLLMLSGGIDSPVAGYLAMKRGIKLDFVYFESIPHTSLEARNKVIDLAKKLAKYEGDMNLIIVPFTKLQEAIYQHVAENYSITIMRRMMYRIMEKLVFRFKSLVIVNGESIGQVASQTLTSMRVINEVIKIPVIRPVACFDKLEIIDISKQIDTYDISILPYEDCCTIFVPKHPIINPDLKHAEAMESLFDYDSMIDDILQNLLILKISENYGENKYDDIL